MKIRTSLTLKYTGITALFFLLSFIMVYYISDVTRSHTFFRNLRGEAVTKAQLFLSKQVDAETMQSIYRNNRQFINEVEVAVYTTDFRMVYHDAIQSDMVKETPRMFREILSSKDGISFNIGRHYQAIGIPYNYQGKEYIITAAAYDGYGHTNLSELRLTLVILFLVGIALLFAAGYLMARNTLRPIRHVVTEAENITASNIHKRLPVKNKNDELGELCMTFNALLARLEKTFSSQKMFISNVSHELRTPLASLTAELDLALQQQRAPEEYREAIANSLQDTARMSTLIEGLLNLAKADYGHDQIKMEEIRLDELLLDARSAVLHNHPEYKIELAFSGESDDDNLITVRGNVYLLNIAFSNLMDNNCKYSPDHSSYIQISSFRQYAILKFTDNGPGMSEEELQNVFTLFYRGNKDKRIKGYGIGMTLAKKIVNLHSGHIYVSSQRNEGTTFTVEMPHI